jgi:hypothetical protein
LILIKEIYSQPFHFNAVLPSTKGMISGDHLNLRHMRS